MMIGYRFANINEGKEAMASWEERRGHQRNPIGVIGQYRTGNGVARDVELLDLSRTGCKFFERFGRLAPDTRISLRIGSVGPLASKVCWRKGQYVGLQFETPLHEAVWEHICASHPVKLAG